MTWPGDIESYCEWMCAGGSGSETLRIRRNYLGRLAARHPEEGPWSLTLDDLVSFVATPRWAPETRKSARSTVRGFYAWGLRTGRVPSNPALDLPTVPIPPSKPKPAPDHVLARSLLAATPRDALMLSLAAYAGLRRGEIARLHHDNIIGDEIHLRGKGGRGRVIPLHPRLALAVAEFAQPGGWVFPGQVAGHLSPGHVGKVLSRRLGRGWTAHKLRHRFATKAYAVDRDIIAVQQLLGHSKPETTVRYVLVPDDAMRAAVLGAA